MNFSMKSTYVLLSLFWLSLASDAKADSSSPWMWHGESSWVYFHAESGWWYMPLVQPGETEPLSGWVWHGALPWVYSHTDGTWRYVTAGLIGEFVAWKQGDGQWYAFKEAYKRWNSVTAALSEITLNDAVDVETNRATISCVVESTSGDNPEIIACWGTWDGSQTGDFSESEANLGPKNVGTFLKTVTVPNKNTLYYFRFKATNSAGVTWSEVKTFTTLAN
jgi:hypothetical protein